MINNILTAYRQIFLLLLCFFFVACAPLAIAPLPETAKPIAWGDRWTKLNKTACEIHDTLQAIADVNLQTAGKRYHFKAALLLKRPTLMRLESIPLIGPPDFLLSLTKTNLKVFFPGKSEFYLGRPVRENLALFLPVGLPPADIVSILLGLPPPPPVAGQFEIRETPPGNSPGLELFSEGLKVQTLWFTDDGASLSSREIIPPEGGRIIVNYEDYRQLGNSWLPEKVTITAPDKDARIAVRYHDMAWSEDGDEAIFDLPIPANVQPRLLP